MVFIIESIVLCGLFTLAVRFKLMRDPIKGIMSYPPTIRKRVESLPQYQGTIQQEERTHIGKKVLAVPVMAVFMAAASWLGGTRDFFCALLYIFGLYTVVNLWDLIVLDWLWFSAAIRCGCPAQRTWTKSTAIRCSICAGFLRAAQLVRSSARLPPA